MKSSERLEKLTLLHLWKPQTVTVQPEMVTENLEEDQDQDPRTDPAKRNPGLAQDRKRRRSHGHVRGKGHMNARGQEKGGQGRKTRNQRKKRRVRGVDHGVGIEGGVETETMIGGVETKMEVMLMNSRNTKT